MTIQQCPITGDAVVTTHSVDDGTARIYEWTRADPEIHVERALLAEPEAWTLITAVYEVGETCPHDWRIAHARLRDGATTPEERREALARCWVDSLTGRAGVLDRITPLVESGLAEKDADIAGLRSLIEAYEFKFVAKNAEIERLRTAVLNGCEKPCVIESDLLHIARADERRRTAEEIAQAVFEDIHPDAGAYSEGFLDALNLAARIAREVGGSDDQQ